MKVARTVKTILSIFAIIVLLFILGIIIPKVAYHNSKTLSTLDIACVMYAEDEIDGGLERLFILKTVATKKAGKTIFAEAYTLFGIHYGTVEVDSCDVVPEGGFDTHNGRFFRD